MRHDPLSQRAAKEKAPTNELTTTLLFDPARLPLALVLGVVTPLVVATDRLPLATACSSSCVAISSSRPSRSALGTATFG